MYGLLGYYIRLIYSNHSFRLHPTDFDSITNENDICLLKLAGEISYTDYIVPTCLPENNSTVPDDTNCTVIGWGDTKGMKVFHIVCI